MGIINKIFKPRVSYRPLIEVRIFKDALQHNLSQYQTNYPELQFVPVIKSNAYGHGLVEVAKILAGQNAPFFMVDSFYEALTLRTSGIKSKLLILGYCREQQLLSAQLENVSLGIIDITQLKNIVGKLNQTQNFHLKVDTGMHRQGILISQADEAIKLIKSNPNFILEGLCSHFADADGHSQDFTREQIKEWNAVAAKFRQNFPAIKYFHTSNTAGVAYAKDIDANVSRLGLGLYGINTSPLVNLNLKPALEVASVVSSIRTVAPGEKIGYGITYEAKRPMIVATVPVGYNEGVDKRLSNQGSYKIAGRLCPLVGRVSMNISSVDVTEISDIKLEDEVVIISGQKTDANSVENIAKLCDCIPYEVLVRIPSQLKRIIV